MKARRLPSLSALRAFEAAARYQSAQLAAKELSVTPTAISHQVRQLEEALGIALFVRKPRQLILTPSGRLLLATLSEAFDAIDTTVQRIRSQPARSVVTLSTIPAIAARRLLPWVCYLREMHPTLDLRIQASHEPVALDGVTADMAIRYGDGSWPGLVAEKLFDNVFVPACSPALGLRRHEELPRHTLLHFEPPGVFTERLDWASWQQQARVPGLDVRAGLVFSDETHTITAALDGQGIALMSLPLISDELDSGRLIRPFGPDLPGKPFYLVYPPERRNEPAIAAVRDWITDLTHRHPDKCQTMPSP
ncbi:LysR family transcriptional regulator [Alkalilimnicola ehrlichii]|uniref:LysR family transcriptional regulator n=1 Tax=Alkalilimnicola ehrlichii TaxID=351052 RepID=A0A3E0WJG7_9GAMM|nr:LysR substrate-binding domain-containing protein [Alkalilimnicola ehrlichii]RFA25212.1 LysR family transcriptional regulator [Alkalilimnicola ehrlichii]RFA32291.1 LysR family transcriptional regulator [Alkalilimnicola ehrlichii]